MLGPEGVRVGGLGSEGLGGVGIGGLGSEGLGMGGWEWGWGGWGRRGWGRGCWGQRGLGLEGLGSEGVGVGGGYDWGVGDGAKVYDSLQSLNEKNRKVNSPFSVEKAICELNRPTVAVLFTVEDVPQQDGGSDCGLFAIAFAASLCQNINPNSLVIKQQAKRPAFLKCIDNNDMSTFLNDIVLSRSRLFKNDPLTSTQV